MALPLVSSGLVSRIDKFFLLGLFLLALLFACAVVLPNAVQRIDGQYPFQGIEMMATDAETYYAVRFREILDGHPRLGNAYLSAPKDQPAIQPPIPEWTLATISRLTPFNPALDFILLKGLCAFAVFLIAFLFANAITSRRCESLAAVTVMLFAAAAFSAPWNLLDVISSGSFAVFGWLRFARPVNPLWTMMWVYLTIYFLSKWVRKADVVWIVLAACTTSFVLYAYFYAWTYLLTVVGLLFLWYAWHKDTKRLLHILLFFGIFVLLGSIYFMNLAELTQHPWYLETSRRQGLVPSRELVFGAWMIALILLAIVGRRIAWKEQWPLVLALAFAGLIAMNQQLITGQHLFPEHYHWYFVQPLGTLCMTLLVLQLCRAWLRAGLYRGLLMITVLLSVMFGFMQQRDSYGTYRAEWGRKQVYAPVFAFVEKNLPPDSVVHSLDDSLVALLPVYTSMNVYTSSQMLNFLASTERLRDSFFFTLWLKGLTPEDARTEFPTTMRWMVGSNIYASYYRELRGGYDALPDELIDRHIKDYEQYYALSFEEKMKMYPLDYVIATPMDNKTVEYQRLLEGGTDIYSTGGYRVVAIKK